MIKSVSSKTPQVTIEDIDKAPENLPVSEGTDFRQKYEELQKSFREVADREFNLKEENSKLRQNNDTAKILNELIKPSAEKAFKYMYSYSAVVALFLLASGTKDSGFTLPEQVQSFLVGSTAVTVIGLVGMVLTGVFLGARKK